MTITIYYWGVAYETTHTLKDAIGYLHALIEEEREANMENITFITDGTAQERLRATALLTLELDILAAANTTVIEARDYNNQHIGY